MNRTIHFVFAAAALAIAGFGVGAKYGHDKAVASFDVAKTPEYKACISTIARVGIRNTALRRELEAQQDKQAPHAR